MRVRCGPLQGQFVHVQVLRPAPAPVQAHGPRQSLVQRVLDDCLDRGESGAAGEQHHGLVAVLAQEEGAVRPLEAQDVARLHLFEHLVGEQSARQVAHVDLQQAVVMRRSGHGIAAPLAVLEQELDILPGQVVQALVCRELEGNHRHVRCGLFDGLHAAGQNLDLLVLDRADLAAFDDDVAQRAGNAEQRQALRLLFGRQGGFGMRAVVDSALDQFAFAAAAGAVAAAVREPETFAQRGDEHGFVGLHLKAVAAGSDGDLI